MLPCADEEAAERLRSELGVSALAARLLANRGLCEPEAADRFLRPDFSHLPDPFLLPEAEVAAERLKQALAAGEKVWVHGDYDGDGVTSAALWTRLLRKLGADVRVHVPHRHRDGYDMRSAFVQEAKAQGVGLIVTCDCGIQRCDEVEEARAAGIDVIITDHHEPGNELPRAAAVVNPHRKDSRYPFADLAGVGVAYRVGEALIRHLGMPVDGYRRAYCDLAAIGTVTDMASLRGDNRIFVKYGLEAIRATKKPGLRALIRTSGLAEKPIDATGIGFRIGPRLNAIGRVDDSRLALEILMTQDPAEADALAERLECANQERRAEEARILGEALEQIAKADLSDSYCLVLHGEGWNGGVVGIVANKVVQRSGRPTVLIAANPQTGMGRGSARSIPAFNMLEAITACGHLLGEFGGHSHAAGMDIAIENLPAFAEAMNRYATERLTEEDLVPALEAEVELAPIEITVPMLEELRAFEPWGHGNHAPLFISRNVRVAETVRMGAEKQHLKLRTEYDGIPGPDALSWNSADLADHLHPGDQMDLCYKPQLNVWNGRTSVQLMLEDLRPSDEF